MSNKHQQQRQQHQQHVPPPEPNAGERMVLDGPAEPINRWAQLFGRPTFKLPAKASAYSNADGSHTTKLGLVSFNLAGISDTPASIYLARGKRGQDASGPYEYDEIYLSLPTSGMARAQVFSPSSPQAQIELEQFKFNVCQQFEIWFAALEHSDGAVTDGSPAPRLIKRRATVPATK